MNAKGEAAPFANFFSDDTATDMSIYYPSMHDHIQGQAMDSTLPPRRKLKNLLFLVRSFLHFKPEGGGLLSYFISPRACS